MPKVKLNLAGFRQVRQSAGAMHVITEQAKRIADTANELAQTKNAHYDHAVAHATDHGAVALATTKGSVALATTGHGSEGNVKAMEDNAKHNTLLKAVKRR